MEQWAEDEVGGYLTRAEELADKTRGRKYRELSAEEQNLFVGLAFELSDLLECLAEELNPSTKKRIQHFLSHFPESDLQTDLEMEKAISESLDTVANATDEELKEYYDLFDDEEPEGYSDPDYEEEDEEVAPSEGLTDKE